MLDAASVYRPDLDEDRDDGPALGEHCFSDVIDGSPKWMLFGCRRPAANKSGLCQISLRPHQKNGMGASWEFDGNREAPTITPSVDCSKVCGWHGWIRAGRYDPP